VNVSGLIIFAWLAVVSLSVGCVIAGLVENNATHILLGILFATISAHFMMIVMAAATAKLVVKMVRKALRKEIEKLCREE
jgi:hypothetical protein